MGISVRKILHEITFKSTAIQCKNLPANSFAEVSYFETISSVSNLIITFCFKTENNRQCCKAGYFLKIFIRRVTIKSQI